jgi:hypothetical protein
MEMRRSLLALHEPSRRGLHSLLNLIPATPNPLFPEKPQSQSPNNISTSIFNHNHISHRPDRRAFFKIIRHCETEKSEPKFAGFLGPSRFRGPGVD